MKYIFFQNRFVPYPVVGLKSRVVTRVSAGTSHAICQTDRREIYVWGNNKYGQLGLCHYNTMTTPVHLDSFKGYHLTLYKVYAGFDQTAILGCI